MNLSLILILILFCCTPARADWDWAHNEQQACRRHSDCPEKAWCAPIQYWTGDKSNNMIMYESFFCKDSTWEDSFLEWDDGTSPSKFVIMDKSTPLALNEDFVDYCERKGGRTAC